MRTRLNATLYYIACLTVQLTQRVVLRLEESDEC